MTNFLKNNRDEVLETSFNLSNQAIYWLNKEGKFIFANDNALDGLGYTLDELKNRKIWDIDISVNSHEEYLEILEDFKNTNLKKSYILETIHRKKDGDTFPVEVVTKFKNIEDKDYIISYAKDITHRLKRTEKINLYFELINFSKDMILLIDLNNEKIEFANKTVCNTLNYSLDELKQMKMGQIRRPFDGIKKIDTKEVFRKIRKEKNLVTFGFYKTKDGDEIPVETSLQLKSYLGKDFITAISRDISDRIEIENEKEKLNQKLKEYNRTLQQEISKVKNELLEYETIMKKQSKMAAMGEMLENIAHQWRQPLSAISVLSTGMLIQNEEGLLEKNSLSSGLDTIHEQVQYLSKTIDDFRNFFKPNKEKNNFNINELISSAIKLINSRYNNISIDFFKELEDIILFTYENELLQVLLNILSNAVDELVKIEDEKIINIKSYKQNDSFILEIRDSAGGIDENIIERIFEPYFSTKHKYQGTGIGLYMSRNIIKHLAGTIKVQNDKFSYKDKTYSGACFKIEIPCYEKDNNG